MWRLRDCPLPRWAAVCTVWGPIEADARAQGIPATDILTSCVRMVMGDRYRRSMRPRWVRVAIGLTGILCLGALAALSPGTETSGYAAYATGTPFHLPLAMKCVPTPTPTQIPLPGSIVFESRRYWGGTSWDICLMDPDGTRLVNLTNDKNTDTYPS